MHTPCNIIDSRNALTHAQCTALSYMVSGIAIARGDGEVEALTYLLDAGYERAFAERLHVGACPVRETLETWLTDMGGEA